MDRTDEQLARTDSITASMDEVTANMAELSGHVSALAGLARGMIAPGSAPRCSGVAALAYGVRRAVGLRRPGRVAATTAREPGALSGGRRDPGFAGPCRGSAATPARPDARRPAVIRRLFWMIVGALLGVTGYRRVSQLARCDPAGQPGAARPPWRPAGRNVGPRREPVDSRMTCATAWSCIWIVTLG